MRRRCLKRKIDRTSAGAVYFVVKLLFTRSFKVIIYSAVR